MQRYFIDSSEIVDELILPSEIYHHAIRVMRMQEGSTFELVLRNQEIAVMQISKLTKETASAKVINWLQQTVELPVPTTIACAISKSDKAEWIVQKGTELGASKFIFFNGEFSVARWDQKKVTKKIERLSKVALNAAQQAHRSKVPTIEYYQDITAIDFSNYSHKIVAYEEAAKKGEKSNLTKLMMSLQDSRLLATKSELIAIFGPEGGISTKEVNYLGKQNFIFVGLGPRIMRAETAPLYLLSILSFTLELG